MLALCARVEDAVSFSVKALQRCDVALAEQVIEADELIDHMEVEFEEDCLKILALYQPVAVDLRYIVAMLKINNDLERIGDIAVNIAERVSTVQGRRDLESTFDFVAMADQVKAILRLSIEALIDLDAGKARKVMISDDKIDEMHRAATEKVERMMKEDKADISVLLALLYVSRSFERIADHATNIAEDVIYMVEGLIARHYKE